MELHVDPGLRKRLGDNALRLQEARFSLDAMALRYLEEYCRSLQIATSLIQES